MPIGSARADTLEGVDWADTLSGGAGTDTINGGAGDDTFYVYDAGDLAVDVAAGRGQCERLHGCGLRDHIDRITYADRGEFRLVSGAKERTAGALLSRCY